MNPDLQAKIQSFTERASAQGIAPEKIQAFIAQKTGQTAPQQAPGQMIPQMQPQAMPQAPTGFQLTPQQVMAAQLFLPEQQAKAFASAYDIQLKAGEQSAKQEEQEKKKQQAEALKNSALKAAQDLANTKFGGITGIRSIGSFIPGAPEQEAIAAFDQLKSLLTLDNVNYLKGTGALSDKEMAILERASTKLNTNLSDEAFARELNALITELGGTPVQQEQAKKKVETPGEQPQLLNQALGMQQTTMQPTGTQLDQVLQPQGTSQQRQKDLLDTVIELLPVAGGIMGGIVGAGTGAIAGFGVGALPAGAIGTGFGTLAGRGLGEFIQDLTGRQDETTAEAYKSQVLQAGQASVADLVTGGLIKVGAPVVKGIGSKLINVGDDLALRALKPTKTQQRNFASKTGVELKDFVIKNGLFEQGTEQADELIRPLQKSFDDITNKSGLKIDVANLANDFNARIRELKTSGIAGYENIGNALQRQLDSFMGKYGTQVEIDISDLNNLRKGLDKLISESAFTKDSIEAGADKITRDIYVNTVRNAADSAGLVDDAGRSLKDIGQELGKLYSFRDIANTQKYLGTGTLPVGLTRTIGLAGTGAGIGAVGGQGDPKAVITGAMLSLGLPTVLNNPKVIAILAEQLPKIGTAIQQVPANQQTKLATDMLRRLLTQLGAEDINNLGAELAGIE